MPKSIYLVVLPTGTSEAIVVDGRVIESPINELVGKTKGEAKRIVSMMGGSYNWKETVKSTSGPSA